METIVRNILLGIALAAPIGPAGIAVIQSGLNCGFWNAFRTGIGITLADTKLGLWTLGAFILMYLGILSIKGALRGFDFEQTHRSINKNPMISGYLVNISNPLAVLFWVGIFGSSIEQSVSESKVIVLLVSSTILVGILIWHSTMSLLSNWGKRYLNEKTLTFISVSAGVGLLAFGVKFAYSVVVLMIE
jgi:L-lysine exporter family protein LysE/ArgO